MTSSLKDEDIIWKSNPEIIKQFLEQRPDFEQLCSEIAYILRKRLNKTGIETSSVINRAKTLKSFLEKISRKKYEDPFIQISDFAGVRVVYLYQKDLSKIESIIKEEFSIVEKVDKLNEKGTDKFGYGAIHFIVRLGKKSSGARYDDLKKLSCEIQIRTVLQDAWAIIDHHLVYKRESDIPTSLQRRLNSLAGLFETADDQFDNIRQERERYLTQLDQNINSNMFLDNEVNLDTFTKYLNWKFPSYELEYFKGQLNRVFSFVSRRNYQTLKVLDSYINKQLDNLTEIEKIFEAKIRPSEYAGSRISSSLLVSKILSIQDTKYEDDTGNTPLLKHLKKKEEN